MSNAIYSTATVLRDEISRSLRAGGHCYVSSMNGTNQARRIYRARRMGRMLQLQVAGPDRIEWYVVAVRDIVTVDKLTPKEHSYTVGAL